MSKPEELLKDLVLRFPHLCECEESIKKTYEIIAASFEDRGKFLVCGNGGSASDSGHIVGELMKGFLRRRKLSESEKQALKKVDPLRGTEIAETLQGALPAISLVSHVSILTAVANDMDPRLIYAQQVQGYGNKGDTLLGISTSGNAGNVIDAIIVAKAHGLITIGLTGRSGGLMKEICDIIIKVPADSTPLVQELHLPVYHTLCAMLERKFFND